MDITKDQRESLHGQWSSRLAFIMAASGAAVGLGNIWKFPYVTGQNGGGAFVLVYLACVFLMGIPIMMAEIMLGRRGRRNPAKTMALLAEESGRSRHWQVLGFVSVLAGFLIMTYYSVIAGWACDYVYHAASNAFIGKNAASIDMIYQSMIASPSTLIVWHTLVMVATTIVVALGVQQGLEKAILFLFPGMLVLLLILVGFAMQTGYFGHGLSFLFHPDFSKLTSESAIIALGHSFFTLSLACGSIMVYGAYVPKKFSIVQASVAIAATDTIVALISGLAIFPLVFAHGLEPSAGPGLIFKTLPLAFGHMPGGHIFGTLFFLMLVFAAFTSAISLTEPSVAWLMETFDMHRPKAAVIIGFLIWLLGIATALAFNDWSSFKIFGLNIFDALDYLTANIMLPLSGLFIAIFTAWLMKKQFVLDELQIKDGILYRLWHWTLRYLTPIAIAIVFLKYVGLF